MNGRINWMDWAKFLSVALVVPVHIPHATGDQPVTWFMVFLLAVLMFNSGYLKKEEGRKLSDEDISYSSFLRSHFKKYWYQLGIPYLLYNVVFYPYWLVKFYAEHGTMPALSEALRPVWGTLLLQANTSFAEELNGVTWFIAALFIMRLLLDCCLRLRHGHWLMTLLCLLCMALYVVSKATGFTTHYVAVGIFKSLPFYYLGFLCRNFLKPLSSLSLLPSPREGLRVVLWQFLTLLFSILLFQWHAGCEENFPLHMLTYFPTVLFGVLAFTLFCQLLDGIHSQVVVNYSNGTMAFIGLHWMVTGIIRYAILKPLFHVPADYLYTPWQAYLLALIVTLLLYPVIILFLQKAPWMLGKQARKK